MESDLITLCENLLEKCLPEERLKIGELGRVGYEDVISGILDATYDSLDNKALDFNFIIAARREQRELIVASWHPTIPFTYSLRFILEIRKELDLRYCSFGMSSRSEFRPESSSKEDIFEEIERGLQAYQESSLPLVLLGLEEEERK